MLSAAVAIFNLVDEGLPDAMLLLNSKVIVRDKSQLYRVVQPTVFPAAAPASRGWQLEHFPLGAKITAHPRRTGITCPL